MSDLIVVVIMVGFFVVAIWVVRLLGRMIDHDTDPEGFDDEPGDTDGTPDTAGTLGSAAPGSAALDGRSK
jgi:hypothetical protein